MSGFQQFTNFLENGVPVTAGNANRAPRTIDQNVRYVYELLQAASIGSTIFSRQQTVISTALVGQPVYYRASTQQWELALANSENDTDTGAQVISESSHVWGIIHEKLTDTLADILLVGHVEDFDLTNALGGEADEAGQYYLSSTTPGGLTKNRPAITVPVLKSTGNGGVFVNPQWEDLTGHTHFKFELQCIPAGDHVSPGGGRHEITNPDTDIEGWLPADHAIFESNAPAGAVFGYNLSANASLNNVWPPIPVDNADVQWDKGLDADQGYHSVPLGEQGLVILDRYGIWWMSDCYGDVPWDKDLNTSFSDSLSDGLNECPRDLYMRMLLWFTRSSFMTDGTVVTSLSTEDDRISIVCEADPTKEASAGALLISLNLSLTAEGDDTQGFLAFKEFDENTGIFSRGPVAEGVYANSTGVTITGSASTTREIDGSNQTVYHGLIGVTFNSSVNRDLSASLVRLLGATEEYYQGVPYIGFPQSADTAMRLVFRVPTTLELTSPQAKLRLRVLGRAAGTLPDLVITARRIPEPGSLLSPEALPLVDSAVTMTTSAVLANPNEYVDAESELLTVAAGDTYLFTISRESGDGFSAEVGLLRNALIIVPTP